MSKKEAEGIAGAAVIIVMGLSYALGVSIPAIMSFIWPFGLFATIALVVVLYFWGSSFSTLGVTGILLFWIGLLWLNSFGLWQSYGYDGKDFNLGSYLGSAISQNSGGFHSEPVQVHPFVFGNVFLVLWYMVGFITIGVGGILAYKGYEGYDHW